jgi:hypothetical protein
VNAYAVALENRGRAPVTLRLALEAGTAETSVRPEAVTLGPGEHRRLTAVAWMRGAGGAGGPVEATFSAQAADGALRAARRVPFVVPEVR